MSAARRSPRVVAELGRPETPDETAARKAEGSRLYRTRKTVNNLVLSLLAVLATVLVIVLIVPRSDTPLTRNVDYHQVAEQTQPSVDLTIVDPELPATWRSNSAEWRTGGTGGVESWYVGFLTPADDFIGMTQAVEPNSTWLAGQLQNQRATETSTIDGVTWDVYRNQSPEQDRGNFATALVTESGDSTYLLIGTAERTEFDALASALAGGILRNGEQ